MDFVLSPESDDLSDERSDDEYLFEYISDTDFSDVEELAVDDARSETSFAASLNSVACDSVTAIASSFGSGVKASRNDMLRAWGLMKLKTGSSAMQHTWLMRHECVQLSALWTLWRIEKVQEEFISSWY